MLFFKVQSYIKFVFVNIRKSRIVVIIGLYVVCSLSRYEKCFHSI